ncbi:MAG TPA: hypothetical protein PKA63_02685 [Oligoflexia bacterium]|nr:hypothetical protein [Oligoflexia bacterium]HMP47559.1 hypothetical protein [Oligoflexia bacterium]
MTDNLKLPSPSDEGFIGRFLNEGLKVFKYSLFFTLPILLLLILSYTGFIRSDALLMLLSVILVVLGIPLSVAFRVDQLSLELGASYSREAILVFALIVSVMNISILLGFWRALTKNRRWSD